MAVGGLTSLGPERIRACRAMLKHVSHPARLRVNPIVERIAAAAGLAIEACSDETLSTLVGSAIEGALIALPPRQAAIIRRCDLGGERYADVARALFVSERHAFRERDAAVGFILERLTVGARRAAPRATSPASTFSLGNSRRHARWSTTGTGKVPRSCSKNWPRRCRRTAVR
jgi:hypothetical protein